MDTVGIILKNKREELGIDLEKTSEDTKIRRKYIEAIENGTYNQIPDVVYTKSFLRIYSDYLGLDQVFILKRFFDETSPVEIVEKYSSRKNSFISFFSNNMTFIVIVLVVALIVGFSTWGIAKHIFSNQNAQYIEQPEDQEKSIPEETQTTEEIDQNELSHVSITEEELEPIHFFNRLRVEILADTSNNGNCWILPVVDGENKSSYTMRNQVNSASYECEKDFRINLGNAGIITLNVNGFAIDNLGDNGEVITLLVSLEQENSITVTTIKDDVITDTKQFEKNKQSP
ncbi:MAG: helix-turn-helix domain-containing protein [Caldisericia bacterium]|nr:helix-turn-helix domain-containing protein [Caldisericia bacterium]